MKDFNDDNINLITSEKYQIKIYKNSSVEYIDKTNECIGKCKHNLYG